MKVFNAIIGVFAIFASIYTMCFPGLSFLKAGWIVTIVLCVWGVCALFEVLTKKMTGADGKITAGGAILALLGGVAAAALSTVAVFRPGLSAMFDLVAVWIFTAWLIAGGVSSIVSAVKVVKPLGGGAWIFSLILGILTLFAGIYGVFHILVMAQTLGLLLGILLMLYGVRLIASLFEKSN